MKLDFPNYSYNLVYTLHFFFHVLIGLLGYYKERDPSGNLQPNSTRFPSGMKALADYVRFLVLSGEVSD